MFKDNQSVLPLTYSVHILYTWLTVKTIASKSSHSTIIKELDIQVLTLK